MRGSPGSRHSNASQVAYGAISAVMRFPLPHHARRDRKHFERAPGHVAGAYCIRLSSNGAVLLGE